MADYLSDNEVFGVGYLSEAEVFGGGTAAPERSWLDAAKDTAAQLAEGVNNIAGAVPNLVAPQSGVAEFFRSNADHWRAEQSPAMLQKVADAEAKIATADQDSIIDQVVAAAKAYSADPALAARFVATNLPSMIPGIGVAKLAQATRLASGASAAAAASTATTAAGGVNAVLNAGGARGEAFEDVRNTLLAQGRSEEEAERIALDKSLLPAAVGGATGFLSGKVGLERALVGGGVARGGVSAGLRSAGVEMLGEQAEELAPQAATNYQAGEFDQRPWSRNIGRTAVETAVASGPSSVVSGGLTAQGVIAAERARLEQMRTVKRRAQEFVEEKRQQAVAEIGAQASVDGAIAAATRAVNIDSSQLLADALGSVGIDLNELNQADAAEMAAAQAMAQAPERAPVAAAGQGAPMAGNVSPVQPDAPIVSAPVNQNEQPAYQSNPARVWYGRRGDGYVTPEDADRGLKERTRLSPGLDWNVEQTPDGKYRLAGYAPVAASALPAGVQQEQSIVAASPDAMAAPNESAAASASVGGVSVVLQNRDRTSAASVAQMNDIAARPDYMRAGPSREMQTGAPVVVGDVPATALAGRSETVVDGRGDRVQAQYMVVEAADLLASNRADGTPNQRYAEGASGMLRAVAGNGRTAGIQAAYERGTANSYQQELLADAQALGVDPAAIAAMQRPVLVRVMRAEDVRTDMGDRTNIASTQDLSALEQATNDAGRIQIARLQFDENGDPTPESIRAFIHSTPVSERGKMQNPDGSHTRQAIDRLMAATFKQAYASDDLVRLYAQATNLEARAVMAALADASGAMAGMAGAGALDIRQAVADAAKMAVNATRRGLKLADLVQNADLDMSPEAFVVAKFMADNIRSAKRMGDGLRAWAQFAAEQARIARENETQTGIFGDQPTVTREQLFQLIGQQDIPGAAQSARFADAAGRAERQGADGAAAAAGPADRGFFTDDAPAPEVGEAQARGGAVDFEKNQPAAPANQALSATENVADAGQPEALELTAPTPADIQSQQLAQEQAAKAEAARKRADAAAAQADDDRKRIAAANVAAAGSFELGQDALDSLTGQGGLMFSRGAGRFTAMAVPQQTVAWLGFDGPVSLRADLQALINRHQEYYDTTEDVVRDIAFVMERPDNWYIHDGGKVMLFREGDGNQVPQVRVELERSGADLVVRSVYVGNRRQIAKKMADKRKVLGGIGLGGQSLDSLSVADYLAALGDRSSRPESSSDNSPDAQGDGTAGGGSGQPAFSFAGARAATADTMALATAQDRLDAGEDAELVRQETGWHKGNDGQWRFEISDDEAMVRADTDGREGRRTFAQMFPTHAYDGGLTVGNVLWHPKLLAAYPAVADIQLKYGYDMRGTGALGAFNSATNTITLNADATWEGALSTLLHEIQHGIQNIEGFATGGSIESARAMQADAQSSAFSKAQGAWYESRTRWPSAYKALMDQRMLDGRLYDKYGIKTTDEDGRPRKAIVLAVELRQKISEADKAMRSQAQLAYSDAVESELGGFGSDAFNEFNGLYGAVTKAFEGTSETPTSVYKRLAGEVEARNTQTRQKMPDAERRATSPSQTADVADADVIVVFNGKEMASAPMPANAGDSMSPDLARTILALGRPPARATKESVRAAVRELVNGLGLLPNSLGRVVVATSAEIKKDWEPLIGAVAMESEDAGRAQGFYDPKSKTVFLIADHIRQGDELGVAAHELMHKHGPTVLGKDGWNQLHGAIGGWAKAKTGTMERIVYDEAARRVRASGPELSNQELFPYAVQVALEMGVRPNAMAPQGTVARWLAQVRAALRQVWSKIAGGKGDFNSLDLVNLAFGIAQRENPAQMGDLDNALNGEGAADQVGEKVSFSRESPATSVWADDESIVADINRAIARSGARVAAVATFDELPQHVKDVAAVNGVKPAEMRGITLGGGQVYVVQGNHSSAAEVEATIVHEVYGHVGIRALFGADIYRRLNKLYLSLGESRVRALAEKYGVEASYFEMARGLAAPQVATRRAGGAAELRNGWLTEELLAHIAESETGTLRQRAREVAGAVRAWLRENGFMRLADLGMTDIAHILKRGRLALETQTDFSGAEDVPAFSRASGGFDLPAETRWLKKRRRMQDYFLRVQQVQKAVLEQGGKLDEQTDTYLAEELSHGRAAALLQDFARDQVEPLMEKALRLGIELEELSLFAYAMHAPERNAQIAGIDPQLQDGGSGMTNADAQAIIDQARQDGKLADLQDLHAYLMAITQTNRLVMLDEGLITQTEFDALNGAYQNYIPLRGFEVVDEAGKPTGRSAGKGFNIRGAETLRAKGRTSRAGLLIENALADYQRTVVRAERNQVAKVFLNFAMKNPDPDLWEIDALTTRKSIDRTTGRIARTTAIDKGEDTIAVKVNGVEIFIRINDELLLRAMKKSHSDDTGETERFLMRSVGMYTSLLRNTLTRYNPEFAVVNAARDFGFGSAAMLDELGEKGAAKFVAHYRGAVAVSARNERNKLDPQARDWDKWFTEYRAAGGTTSGFYAKGAEDISKDIRQMLLSAGAQPKDWTERLVANKPVRAVQAALRVLEFAGSTSENAARVAAYRTAREMGKTPAQAASIAKNLTTNFDRKGELGQLTNSFYVFFNAAVQGSHRTLKMLANKKVMGYMAGVSAASAVIAMTSALLGGDDPDDDMAYWDKIPAYVKERNFVIMLPPDVQIEGVQEVGSKGRYIAIPVQYGLNVFHLLGYQIADVIRNQKDKTRGVSLAKAGVTMASALAGSFNPLGGAVDLANGSSIAQAVAPSLMDPVIQLATGTNGFGRDVAPFKSPFDTSPDSDNVNVRQEGGAAHRVAQWINATTGGDEYESGAIDVSPGTLENVVRNLTGGTGAFIYDVLNLAGKGIEQSMGGDPDVFVRDIPFGRKLYGETAGDVDQGLFYERRKAIEEARGIQKRRDDAGLDMNDSEKEAQAGLSKDASKYTKWLSGNRKEMVEVKKDAEMSDLEKRVRLRELRAERDTLTSEFNKAWMETMKEWAADQQSN